MEILLSTLLVLHIAGGSIGLVSGTINLIRKKGDKLHKMIGTIFYYGMLITGTTSLLLAAIHPNHFLFIIGVFTLYLVVTGQRYLAKSRKGSIDSFDRIITYAMMAAAISFITIGTYYLVNSNFFGAVYIVFGGFGLLFVKGDLTYYAGKSRFKNYPLLSHIQRMTGGYIAALTAFLVVNSDKFPEGVPAVAAWLAPTILVVPLIIYWSRRYQVGRK